EWRTERQISKGRPELPRPGDGLISKQSREQLELFLENVLVVGEVVSEQGKRLRQRTASDDELSPAVGHGVEGGKFGVHPNRILSTQNGHGCAKPDALGSAGNRSQDHMPS